MNIVLNLLTLLFLGYLRESTNSLLWTELVYSASDLLKFINDRAYDQAFRTANAIQKEKIGEVICFFFRNSNRFFLYNSVEICCSNQGFLENSNKIIHLLQGLYSVSCSIKCPGLKFSHFNI